MVRMNDIVEKPIKTILDDISTEMSSNLLMIDDVIQALASDTYTIEEVDENGRIIHTTIINPNLLSWLKEKRMTLVEKWKLAGGELHQEKEKEKIKIQGKMILDTISSMSPEELKEKREQWKKSYDTRNDD